MMKETLGGLAGSPKLCIITPSPGVSAFREGKPFSKYEVSLLKDWCINHKLFDYEIELISIKNYRGFATNEEIKRCFDYLNSQENLRVILPMGEQLLNNFCGKSSIDKWQASPLDSVTYLRCPKVIPLYDFPRIYKDFKLSFYNNVAFAKAKKGMEYEGPWKRKTYNFIINPNSIHTYEIINWLKTNKKPIALDIETGRGQINTLGIAWSERDALVLNMLPNNYNPEGYHQIWKSIAELLEDPDVPKIMQNGIYETQRLFEYGIVIRNYHHDTMWCMKFLWPEFEKGLGNVGRFYTMEPYWKDEGKVKKNEEGRRVWNEVRDWERHYRYNAKDCTGTYEAWINQRKDLEARGLSEVFAKLVMRLADPLQEMTLSGVRVIKERKETAAAKLRGELEALEKKLSVEINPGSAKQKLELLRSKGYAIPKVKIGGKYQESTNELALKKLRLKYPNDEDIKILLKHAKVKKALTSYVNFKFHEDGIIRYAYDGHGTETGRLSCGKDAWDKGLNMQTIPKEFKNLFAPVNPGWVFIQCDLQQAESRFVAYDSADYNLIEMLEDPTKDIHSYVAAEIFKVPVEQVIKEKNEGNPAKRQLGKKSGHGANYSMGINTFIESCLKEMDLVLTKKQAENVLEAYHKLFPGIRRWHAKIREHVKKFRQLQNPLGRVRYFYGRLDDNLFREAYAYRPQSTIPDITNHLMFKLIEERKKGHMNFQLHLQVHDSIVLSCPEDEKSKIAEFCKNTDLWHPEIRLSAGKLVIPTDVEWGYDLKNMKSFEGGK